MSLPCRDDWGSKMNRTCFAAVISVAAVFGAAAVHADTTDVKSIDRVTVAKQGAHCADDPHCFNRLHPAIPPVLRAAPGQHIVFETRDALDNQLNRDSAARSLGNQRTRDYGSYRGSGGGRSGAGYRPSRGGGGFRGGGRRR